MKIITISILLILTVVFIPVCNYYFDIPLEAVHWQILKKLFFYLASQQVVLGSIGSITGCILLILLFQGSARFSEEISNSKYPEYGEYQKKVEMFVPV